LKWSRASKGPKPKTSLNFKLLLILARGQAFWGAAGIKGWLQMVPAPLIFPALAIAGYPEGPIGGG
jgi:hypothetical protein